MGNRKAFRLDLTLRHLLLLLFTVCECTKVSLTPRRKQLHWLSKTDEDVVSSPDVPTRIRGGSAQRRWERMDGKSYGGLTSSNGGEAGNSFQKSLQSVTVENEVGRACDFYVWDAPSALLHKWCHHLLKDCVYEGLGGRKVCSHLIYGIFIFQINRQICYFVGSYIPYSFLPLLLLFSL